MLFLFLKIALSNNFTYTVTNDDYFGNFFYNGKVFLRYFQTVWNIRSQSSRYISGKTNKSDFYNGILITSSIITQETEDKLRIEFTIQNNGTNSKTIYLQTRFNPYFGDNYYIKVEQFGNFQGYKYSAPSTNETMTVLFNDENNGNANYYYHSTASSSSYSNLNPISSVKYHDIYIRWDNINIDVDETLKFYMTFLIPEEKISPKISIDSDILDTYEKESEVEIRGHCDGYENGQFIKLYYIYDGNNLEKISEFTVSDEVTALEFTLRFNFPNDRTGKWLTVWAITKDAVVKNFAHFRINVGDKPRLQILNDPSGKYSRNAELALTFTGYAERWANIYYRFDDGRQYNLPTDYYLSLIHI